ncbi:MAG: hypothetical protein WKF87_12325 [Chryseolinea sp.]
MAKATAKTATGTAPKKASSATKGTGASIEKATKDALTVLKSLGIDHQLQADIEWCLGSYDTDGNPSGLYEMAEKSIKVLAVEKERKSKGVTSKLIADLEKALQSR